MQIVVKKYGAQMEFDDAEWFSQDEEIATMMSELPRLERIIASRPLYGLAPILDADDDDDFGDLDMREFVKRTYQ